MKFSKTIFAVCCFMLSQAAPAHGPFPVPLIGAPIPPVPGLVDGADPIVVNKDMAIALGKALFWDVNIGSDGMACASCHFHAGADNRVKNQISPGTLSPHPSGQTFDTLASGMGGPNHTLTASDFPLLQFADPLDNSSEMISVTDDAITSSGSFSGVFTGSSRFSGMNDDCIRSASPMFNVNGTGTRQTGPRNAPTVINAVFNHRNFWDGRANNIFNGVNNWGDRDPDAGVWVQVNRRTVKKQRLRLENSSLASQVVATALSQLEMTCSNRSIADIGRKVLLRQPLQHQKVHTNDSVFGPLNLNKPLNSAGELQAGLKTTYKTMIRKSFARKYWSYRRRGQFGAPAIGGTAYNQMEANFPMFMALAIQLYETTLVSDQAPIDTVARNPFSYKPTGLTESEVRGMETFTSLHCNICHAGPSLTAAAVVANSALVTPTPNAFYGPSHSLREFGPHAMGAGGFSASDAGITQFPNVVTRDISRMPAPSKLHDFGYFNTGVGDPNSDPGLGGLDDFGKPLSFSSQYVQYLIGNYQNIKDQAVKQVRSCQFIAPLAKDLGIEFNLHGMFTLSADREADGSREGLAEVSARSQNCRDDKMTFIPTVEAAITAFNNPADRKLIIAEQAAFKVPTLRNIELTGPYMHNGSMATLEQVVEFYTRGGNIVNNNMHNFIAPLSGLQTDSQRRADLVAFLKTLTDDRVRYEQAPFDHPELTIPNGHQGDDAFVKTGNPLSPALSKEEFITIPAVGANGTATALLPFEANLAP